MKIICSRCGKEVDRTKKNSVVTCFNCKKIVRAKYNALAKKGKVVVKRTIKKTVPVHVKVENPHEDFSKFGSSLIYTIPLKLSKKKQILNDWAVTKNDKCWYCGHFYTLIHRKDNEDSITKVCEIPHCIMHIFVNQITTWTR